MIINVVKRENGMEVPTISDALMSPKKTSSTAMVMITPSTRVLATLISDSRMVSPLSFITLIGLSGFAALREAITSCTLEEMFADIAPAENLFAGNTTLGVVVTNGKFDKTPLTKIAGMAHNGYARAIRPVHTTADGDSIYALSLGDVPGDINVVGAMAALAMERAILRAVQSAGSAYGLIGWEDLPR